MLVTCLFTLKPVSGFVLIGRNWPISTKLEISFKVTILFQKTGMLCLLSKTLHFLIEFAYCVPQKFQKKNWQSGFNFIVRKLNVVNPKFSQIVA